MAKAPFRTTEDDIKTPTREDAQKIVAQRKKEAEAQKEAKPTPSSSQSDKKSSQPQGPSTSSKTPSKKPSISVPNKGSSQSSKRKGSTSQTPPKKPAPGTKKKAPPKRQKRTKAQVVTKKRDTFDPEVSITILIVACMLIVIIGLSVLYNRFYKEPLLEVYSSVEPTLIEVDIPPGMGARAITELLEFKGVIRDAHVLERYLEQTNLTTTLQSGTYHFPPLMGYDEVASLLSPQQVEKGYVSLTVYAGYTIETIDQLLVNRKVANSGDFLKAVDQIQTSMGLPFTEGWFLSGQYTISLSDGVAYSLANEMFDRLTEALRAYLDRIEEQNWSVSDVLIIASLIQRETNKVSQMPLISGVIANRIKADMSLGIDASLRYALDIWDRELTESELDTQSPFNLRRFKGLPPAPIGSLSLAALDAAIYPSVHPYYYYIHDPSGEIHPAISYDEHKENIERYLR